MSKQGGIIRRFGVPIVFLLVIIVVIFLVVVLRSPTSSQPTANTDLPKILQSYFANVTMPSAVVEDANGKRIRLDETIPSTGLVTFWSSTCNECSEALTTQRDFVKAHPNFQVSLVNVRDSLSVAKSELAKDSINFPSYYDTDSSASQSWSATMPASYYIKNGKILLYFPGRISLDHLNALLQIK